MFLYNFLKKNKTAQYESEKALVLSGDVKDRLKIARNAKTHPEILFYMAQSDGDASVRSAVAENKSTPVHVAPILSKDKSVDVRLALVARLVTLLPDLSQDKQSQLYHFAVEALGNLALDNVLTVRVALSSALKDVADAPPEVVGRLARDVERQVSEPILRFCVALPDADLLEILKGHPDPWVVRAIANRPKVSSSVSQAVIDTRDVSAGESLLSNNGAEISLATLKDIIALARSYPSWQKPVAMKKGLTVDLLKELVGFVDDSVRDVLMHHTNFSPDILQDVTDTVQRRVNFVTQGAGATPSRAKALHAASGLTYDVINDALSMREKDFVVEAVALLAGVNGQELSRLLNTKAPKPIVAICWKAGLPMRFALRVQQEIAQVPHTELIYPSGGTDYPMVEADLKRQLEFLGIA